MLLKSAVTLFCGLLIQVICLSQTITPSGAAGFCTGGKVTLTATGGNTYGWLKDETLIPGATLAAYDVTAAGNYTVTITRSNKPDTLLGPVAVTENANPVVDFKIGEDNNCSGKAIQYTSLVNGGNAPYSYSWVFGDNNTSNVANPIYGDVLIGCGNGSLTDKLTVTDANGCTANSAKIINILKAPDVDVEEASGFDFNNCSNNPNASNPDYSITVNNISIDKSCVSNYEINWGDGNIQSSLTNDSFPLQHTYKKIGAFDLRITGLGINGCKNSKSHKIKNQSYPDAGLGKFGTSSGCDTVTASITVTTWQNNSVGTIYELKFGDGTSKFFTHPINTNYADDTTYHQYTTSPCAIGLKSFPISITATNSCKSETFSGGTIEVNLRPKAAFKSDTSVCVNKSICFTNTTLKGYYNNNTDCSTSTQYNWDFGDPLSGTLNTSTEENPCHTYLTAGTYTVKLTSKNSCGPSTATRQICVMAPPTALFTLNAKNGCVPFTATATNISDTGSCKATSFEWVVSYNPNYCGTSPSWTFAPGSDASSTNPSFIFNNPGDYTITLKIKSPCQDVIFTDVVNAKGLPNLQLPADTSTCGVFTYNPRAIIPSCETGSFTYAWTFANANPSTVNNADPGIITFNGEGSHLISLNALNGCGATTVSQTFTVNPSPDLSSRSDTSFCAGENTGMFQFLSTNGGAISWTNTNPAIGLAASGTGDITNFIATNTTNAPINANIKVTAAIGNCAKDYSFNITVNPKPQPPVVTNVNYCVGNAAVALTASGTGTILWYNVSSGGVGNTAAPVPQTATEGIASYYVTSKTDATGCESDRATITVAVNPVPNISNSSHTDPISCGSLTGSITLNGLLPNTAYVVHFTKTGNQVSTVNVSSGNDGNLTIAGLDAGEYNNVSVDLSSCTSNSVGAFLLKDPVTPDAPVATSNAPLCSTGKLQLDATTSLTGNISYLWTGPDNFTSTSASAFINNVSILASGKYFVTVKQNNCTSLAGEVDVVINPTPVITSINNNGPLCDQENLQLNVTATPDAASYAWTGPDNFMRTEQNPVINKAGLAAAGVYTVIATGTPGNCVSLPSSTNVVINPVPVITNTTFTNPNNCGSSTGSIVLYGLAANNSYTITFLRNNVQDSKIIAATADATVTIDNITAGIYTNITAALNGCTSNPAGQVTLSDPNPPPAPVATGSSPICSGNSINLSAASSVSGNVIFNWQGPNGFSSPIFNPVITNTDIRATGKYFVTVTVNNCVSASDSVDILVNATPALPSITSNSPVCTGNDIRLQTANDAGLTYLWSGPDGFTNTAAGFVISNASLSHSGTYQLKVTSVDGNCPSPTASANIAVNPTPAITGTSSVNPVRCGSPTGSITLDGLMPGTSYDISYNNVAGAFVKVNITSDPGGAVNIHGLTAGSYTNIAATLTGCSSNNISSIVLTDPNPPASPTASGITPLCTGDTIQLSAVTNIAEAVSYSWTGPGNYTSSEKFPVITSADVNRSGKYYVRIILNNCISLPDSVDIIVNSRPADPVLSSNSPVCREDSLKLSATSATPGSISYFWTGPNGFTSNEQSPVIAKASPAAAGRYTAIAKQLNCFSISDGATIVAIKPKPDITSVTVNNPTSCGSYTGSIVLEGFAPNTVYGLAYTWNNETPADLFATSNPAGAIVIRDLPSGIYTDIKVIENSCPSNPAGPLKLINIPPVTPTVGSNSPLCAGTALQLNSGLDVTGTVTYAWLGPNGFTSNLQNPVIPAITEAGIGTYTVTATLNGCSSSNTAAVFISASSKGGFTGVDSTVCLGTNTGVIHLTGYTGDIKRWQSSVDNGITWNEIINTTTTLFYSNLTASTLYRAAVQSGVCLVDYSTLSKVKVVDKVDDANAGADQKLCNQSIANLIANNPAVGKGIWTQVDGSVLTINNPDNSATAVTGLQSDKTYTFRWTITGAVGCGSSNDETVIINRPAITAAVAGRDVNICDFTSARTLDLTGNTFRTFEKGQ